ncbi:MAG: hypothetical protein IJ196_07040 [Prevotella sp.]|nr:hypothetical protein [Prevotella sp.]
MDLLTKELQNYLLRMRYEPGNVSGRMEHYMEHLMHLLPATDKEDLLHYFGIMGHEQWSLQQIARLRDLTSEDMLARIDRNLRKLAVTPEWQLLAKAVADTRKPQNQ